MWKVSYINFWFWVFWCIKRWYRLKNGQVSEIDLQYWPWPPSFQVWPLILKSVQWNLHLFFILSILVYWTLESVKNGQVSEIDLQHWPRLDLPASKFDLRSWKVWRATYIYFLFWAYWCIKRWNRLKNGQVSEIDLQYWPRPPSFQVWPPILKNVKGNLHLFLILSISVY